MVGAHGAVEASGSSSPTISACLQWQSHKGPRGAAHVGATGSGLGRTVAPELRGPGKEMPPALSSPHHGVLARFTTPQHLQMLGAVGTLPLPTARKGVYHSLRGLGAAEPIPALATAALPPSAGGKGQQRDHGLPQPPGCAAPSPPASGNSPEVGGPWPAVRKRVL